MLEMSVKIKYFLIGFVFGCCFPIGAFAFEMVSGNQPLSVETILEIHQSNKLLFMIDSAPVFLGLFALLGGISKSRSLLLLKEIKGISEHLFDISEHLTLSSQNAMDHYNEHSSIIKNKSHHLMDTNHKNHSCLVEARDKSKSLNENF